MQWNEALSKQLQWNEALSKQPYQMPVGISQTSIASKLQKNDYKLGT